MKTPGLTVIIPTRNAGTRFFAAVASASALGPVVVVDAQSDDGTAERALAAGARVVRSTERSPARQRNEGIALAATEWVFCLDADEEVGPPLRAEIARRVAEGGPHAGYWVPRVNWYLGRRIRHSGWQRDRVLRLFRSEAGRWRDEHLHERLALQGSAGVLSNPIEHRSYETLDDVWEKLDRYSTWGARELVRAGRPAGPWEMITHPPARFLKTYLLRAGFLDGAHGALLASVAAFGVLLRYAKAWEIRAADGAGAADPS